MLVKIFKGSLNSETEDFEERINHWLGSLKDEAAEVKRMSTVAYAAGSDEHLVVTFLYQSPLEAD